MRPWHLDLPKLQWSPGSRSQSQDSFWAWHKRKPCSGCLAPVIPSCRDSAISLSALTCGFHLPRPGVAVLSLLSSRAWLLFFPSARLLRSPPNLGPVLIPGPLIVVGLVVSACHVLSPCRRLKAAESRGVFLTCHPAIFEMKQISQN